MGIPGSLRARVILSFWSAGDRPVVPYFKRYNDLPFQCSSEIFVQAFFPGGVEPGEIITAVPCFLPGLQYHRYISVMHMIGRIIRKAPDKSQNMRAVDFLHDICQAVHLLLDIYIFRSAYGRPAVEVGSTQEKNRFSFPGKVKWVFFKRGY